MMNLQELILKILFVMWDAGRVNRVLMNHIHDIIELDKENCRAETDGLLLETPTEFNL